MNGNAKEGVVDGGKNVVVSGVELDLIQSLDLLERQLHSIFSKLESSFDTQYEIESAYGDINRVLEQMSKLEKSMIDSGAAEFTLNDKNKSMDEIELNASQAKSQLDKTSNELLVSASTTSRIVLQKLAP
mmetsp:Transcript_5796/g.10255  ORF Transcript_5796/g.10255 Transcript_5796/m.10255 type:complete len:130 (+) Transcript_5796:81-470(+)